MKYKTIIELECEAARLGINMGISNDISALFSPLTVGDYALPNRLAVHPMEGCDGTHDGSPDELTYRRYKRFSEGGAGLLWYEATAVVPEARANPRQLYLSKENKAIFARLLEDSRLSRKGIYGNDYDAFEVLQLTHSGRYSKPQGRAQPLVTHRDAFLDKPQGITQDYPLLSDSSLERLEDAYVDSAKLAADIGFKAIDIKSCHRYLISELLASHLREGRYGGSYENRTRFLKNVISKIFCALGDRLMIAVRLNAWDAIPYPYGWGMARDGSLDIDLTEPLKLACELAGLGISLINITVGNPYYNPHFGRPYDAGPYHPNEHQLAGINRLISISAKFQSAIPEIPLVGTGFSWLGEFSPYVMASAISANACSIAGVGRMAFAYPDFAKDLLYYGKLDPRRCCSACSLCSVIMRDGGCSGCVLRDADVYGPIYKQGRKGAPTSGDIERDEPTWHI